MANNLIAQIVLVYLSDLTCMILTLVLTRKFNRKGIMLFSLMFSASSNLAIYPIPKEQTSLLFSVSAFAVLGTSLASIITYTKNRKSPGKPEVFRGF